MLLDLNLYDCVVIEFGHNYAAEKPDRYTSPEEYEQNFRKFLNDVKEKGGIPILCTSVSARKFIDGRFVKTLQVYSDVVHRYGRKREDIIQNYGEKGSEGMFVILKPEVNRNFLNGINEITHFNEHGATLMTKTFNKGLRELKVEDYTSNLRSK